MVLRMIRVKFTPYAVELVEGLEKAMSASRGYPLKFTPKEFIETLGNFVEWSELSLSDLSIYFDAGSEEQLFILELVDA